MKKALKMGIAETFLAGLYFNATCLNESFINHGVRNNLFQKEDYFKNLENELRGMHLTVATVQNGDLSSAIKINGSWFGKGVAFDIFSLLQEMYQFNYSIILPRENTLGSKRSGIFELIYNKKADLGAAFLPMTSASAEYVQFATTLDLGEWVAIIKRPNATVDGSGLLAPFTLNVWLLILLSLLIVAPIMYFIISVQFKIQNSDKSKVSLSNCFWFLYGALLKQGTVLTPLSDSFRLLFATWWLFVIILTAFYTANLTAFLTLSEFRLPIASLEELGNKQYPIVAISGTVLEESANNRFEEVYYTLRKSEKKFVKENGLQILERWVTERNYIYIAEKPIIDITLYEAYLKRVKRKDISVNCPFVVSPWTVYKRPRSFVYSKSFKYAPLFDKTLRNLVEVGISKYYLQRKLPEVNICPLKLHNKERQLRNSNLLLTYYIVAVGFSIATVIFLIEFLELTIKNYKTKKQNNSVNFKQAQKRIMSHYNFFGKAGKKKNINGRTYFEFKSSYGDVTLVPIRSPSALLYQLPQS